MGKKIKKATPPSREESFNDRLQHQRKQPEQFVSTDLAPLYQILVEIRDELKKLNEVKR